MTDDERHLRAVTRHITQVQQNCEKMAERLLEHNPEEFEFVRRLLCNAQVHDNSKFQGAEWLYLRDELKDKKPEVFTAALQQHWATNPHHPEYWLSIHNMPRVYVAEMVADVTARSNEFGTDIKEWIGKTAPKKYGFTKQQKIWKEIKFFLDLLLDKPF